MTRVLVQRGAAGSSSNANRPPSTSATQSAAASQAASTSRDEEQDKDKDFIQEPQSLGEAVEYSRSSGDKSVEIDEGMNGRSQGVNAASQSIGATDKQGSVVDHDVATRELGGLRVSERSEHDGLAGSGIVPSPIVTGCSFLPPPPVPPPKPSNSSMNSIRTGLGSPNATRIGPSRRPASRSVVSVRSTPSGSRATSPRSYGEGDGYNSADEQSPCYVSSYDDAERERLFELDIRRTEGFEVKRMLEDGNCLFRAVADQVYGDPEVYDMVRQMCIDYMERERDHFSQFITEGFMSYCKRKRRDKVYGNNVEIQAFAEMYNRPIHIYSYSAEPINIFEGSYNTDTPPIRLCYHQRNHYNSLVDPQRLTIGAGLGFSGLQGTSIDKDRVKAVIKAQQEQQIDNALIAEGRFYSDLELTEKEIERMVMEASRAEYLAEDKLKQQRGFRESSTSGAEPSSSGARSSPSTVESGRVRASQHDMVLSKSMQMALSMGFSYLQVIEAYSIFGDDVDSMVCYLLEMGGSGDLPGGSSRQKGKAAE